MLISTSTIHTQHTSNPRVSQPYHNNQCIIYVCQCNIVFHSYKSDNLTCLVYTLYHQYIHSSYTYLCVRYTRPIKAYRVHIISIGSKSIHISRNKTTCNGSTINSKLWLSSNVIDQYQFKLNNQLLKSIIVIYEKILA